MTRDAIRSPDFGQGGSIVRPLPPDLENGSRSRVACPWYSVSIPAATGHRGPRPGQVRGRFRRWAVARRRRMSVIRIDKEPDSPENPCISPVARLGVSRSMACPKYSKSCGHIAFALALLLSTVTASLRPLPASTPRRACRIHPDCVLGQAHRSRATATSVSPRSAPVKAIIEERVEDEQVRPSCRSGSFVDPMGTSCLASEIWGLVRPAPIRASHPLRC